MGHKQLVVIGVFLALFMGAAQGQSQTRAAGKSITVYKSPT